MGAMREQLMQVQEAVRSASAELEPASQPAQPQPPLGDDFFSVPDF
jgi:hypothetical protein